MLYSKKDLLDSLNNLQSKFHDWNPEKLSLVSFAENHLVEGENFLGWLRTDNQVENLILDVLEQFCLKSESVGVGSSVNVAFSVLTSSKRKMKEDAIETIQKCSRYPTENDIQQIIKKSFPENYHQLLEKILEYSDSDGHIFLKREVVPKIILEKIDGYVFSLSSPIKMNFDERDVKCFVIDGFVESVGEIHHILESLSKNATPGVIFARNFANDVITTLQYNKRIGRMNVLPVLVTLDVEDLNTLVDIATISECDVVSSDKGNLIRAITTDNVPTLERVVYKNGNLVISNSKTMSKVSFHLENLRKKSENVEEFRKNLYEKRMSSLSSNCLKISIPVGKQFDVMESAIDLFLRIVRSCILYGITEEADGKIIPTASYIASYVFSKKFFDVFQKEVGGAILD